MRKRTILVAAGFTSLLVLALGLRWATGHRLQRVSISRQTTFITAPLDDYGTVDYLEALNARYADGVTPENNAAGPLLKVLGVSVLSPLHVSQLPGKLGDPRLFERADPESRFVSHGEFFADLDENVRYQQAQELVEAPWTRADHPRDAAWIEANARSLSEIRIALQRPRFHIPLIRRNSYTTIFSATIGPLGSFRGLSELLAARAMLHLGEGDNTSALADAADLLRLARLLGQQPSILERLVACSILQRGLTLHAVIAGADGLTTAQRDMLRQQVEQLATLPSLAEAIEWHERFLVLDNITAIARFGINFDESASTPPVRPGPFSFGLFPLHFDPALREANEWIDRLSAAALEANPVVREKRLATINDAATSESRTLRSSSRDALRLLALVSATNGWHRQFRVSAAADYHRQLLLSALRAPTHFAVNGQSEETIGSFLQSLPPDPYSGTLPTGTLRNGVLSIIGSDLLATSTPAAIPSFPTPTRGSPTTRRSQAPRITIRLLQP